MIPFLGSVICIACDVTRLEHWNLVLWQRKVIFLVPGMSLNRTAELLQLKALTWCRQLVTSFPPQKLGFISRAVSVEYDVDKAAMGQVSFCIFKFSLVTLISLVLHTYQSFIYHYHYIILTVVSIMK
jgi:hypothetical protein